MRKALLVVLVSAVPLFAMPLSAQIHGVPASATSLGPNGFTGFGSNNFPGIPASATSLGPNGFTGQSPFFNSRAMFFRTADGRIVRAGRLRRHAQPFFVPFFYSMPFYDDSVSPTITELPAKEAYPAQASLPSAPTPSKLEITIVDKRSDVASRPAADPGNGGQQQSAPTPSAAIPDELATKILVMRDGSKKEIRNYAILGKNLFDLSDGRSRRIPLDDVDVKATTKLNEDNGVDFKLP